MLKRFNKIKYNINRLKPRPEDLILNKCTHKFYCKEDGECAECETNVNPDSNLNEIELSKAMETIIDHLECMKMIINNCMHNKEIKAAQKYFDMIPLLKNLDTLYDICIEELNNTDEDIVDLYEPMVYDDDYDESDYYMDESNTNLQEDENNE